MTEKKHILWLMPLCEWLDEFGQGKISKKFLEKQCKKCFVHGRGIHLICLDGRNLERKAPGISKDIKAIIEKARKEGLLK